MKVHTLEINKFKSASNSVNGLVVFKVDALVTPKEPLEGIEPSSIITMTEANARVLMQLLKAQLAEFDNKKPKSRHGRHG
ncbi:hypothetical protein SNE35_05715 [Paucibacter sp. R3-3]|uniref:DUF1327 domain-containing protein n=1 Tax=Roseateles agri TaxID=3098619 RepID=A0ABU5DCG8_9BURK|nr:hypothetical protein [Paucibacter sp. R3-3]MDY0743989.1 hypothetical protein [Paucibacter sp. R3-3]